LAAVDENRFDCFWNAMAANALGTVARHETDDESAHNWNQNREIAQVVAGRRDHGGAPAAEIKEIGEKADQPEQNERNKRANSSNEDCEKRNGDNANGSCEIAELRMRLIVTQTPFLARFDFGFPLRGSRMVSMARTSAAPVARNSLIRSSTTLARAFSPRGS